MLPRKLDFSHFSFLNNSVLALSLALFFLLNSLVIVLQAQMLNYKYATIRSIRKSF